MLASCLSLSPCVHIVLGRCSTGELRPGSVPKLELGQAFLRIETHICQCSAWQSVLALTRCCFPAEFCC